jgi:hypothetical protein
MEDIFTSHKAAVVSEIDPAAVVPASIAALGTVTAVEGEPIATPRLETGSSLPQAANTKLAKTEVVSVIFFIRSLLL